MHNVNRETLDRAVLTFGTYTVRNVNSSRAATRRLTKGTSLPHLRS